MKKYLALLTAIAGLALVPSALASVNTPGTTPAVCPTDVHTLIANTQLDVNVGGTSSATFTIPDGCVVKVSLVSYTAAAPEFTWDNATQEVVYDQVTENLGAGVHTLSVKTPNCYYQLDLVQGEVIPSFGPYATAPDNFYTPQGRLAASANGGTNVCVAQTATSSVVTAKVVKTQPKVVKPKAKPKAHKKNHSPKPKRLPYTL